MRQIRLLLILFGALVAVSSFGQVVPDSTQPSTFDLDLPLLDGEPMKPLEFPTVQQTTTFAETLTKLIFLPQNNLLPKTDPKVIDYWGRIWPLGLVILETEMLNLVPGSPVWSSGRLQQRILATNGFESSWNWPMLDQYFNPRSPYGLTDNQLQTLKTRSNPSLVRLASSLFETGTLFNYRLSKQAYFAEHGRTRIEALARTAMVANFLIDLGTETSFGGTGLFEMSSLKDPSLGMEKEPILRGVVANPFNSWVYHLFRPNAAIQDLGVHPTGNGFRRIVFRSDLNAEEILFQNIQFGLYFLNFIDLNLFIPSGPGLSVEVSNSTIYFNVVVQHYLAPFGSSTNLAVFWKSLDLKVITSLWNQVNLVGYFPGLEIELIDFPIFNSNLFLGVTLAGWVQPENFGFRAAQWSPGMFSKEILTWMLTPNLGAYAGASQKSAGWYPGQERLEPSGSINAGIRLKF